MKKNDEEYGTDPICKQQRGQKQRKWKKNKTKTTAKLQGVKLTTSNNKTHEMLCIICQKNKKAIAPIGTAAGRKAIMKSAEKRWFGSGNNLIHKFKWYIRLSFRQCLL